MPEFYIKGYELINKAIDQESKGDRVDAKESFVLGLEYLLTGLKYEKNVKVKEKVKTHASAVMKHVEELCQTLQEKPAPSKQQNKSSIDKQNEKLRTQLEDAILKEKPEVDWNSIVGLDAAKNALEEAIILPRKYPQLFTDKRKAWNSILLYGPPGTGKSYIAKAVATMCNATFFSISSADVMSKYLGESERLVKQLFQMASENKPAIIFVDEIDALCSKRSDDETESMRRIKNEFLVQMSEVAHDNQVIVLAATNRPYDLDPALRRRFEKRIYIPLPNAFAREAMIRSQLDPDLVEKMGTKDIHELAKKTEGFSAADLNILIRDALMIPIRNAMNSKYFKYDKENKTIVPCDEKDPNAIRMSLFEIQDPDKLLVHKVTKQDFLKSLSKVKPSVSEEEVKDHERFTEEFGEGDLVAKKMHHPLKAETNPNANRNTNANKDSNTSNTQKKDSKTPGNKIVLL